MTQTHISIPEQWVTAWSADPADGDAALSEWQALYSPTAIYTDHAFQIVRQGHQTLRRHWRLWREANPDFVMTIAESMPAETLPDGRTRFSIRTNNSGTFVQDLPSRKASGKTFYFRGVVDLVVGKDGLIDSVEEWYCSNFDATGSQNEFNFRGDGSSAT